MCEVAHGGRAAVAAHALHAPCVWLSAVLLKPFPPHMAKGALRTRGRPLQRVTKTGKITSRLG